MQVVLTYSDKGSLKDATKAALKEFKNDINTNLIVLCASSQLEQAKDWSAELQKQFATVEVKGFNIPCAVDDSSAQKFFERLYPRLRQVPHNEESIYLHPMEVPAEDLWDIKFRDELRLTKKTIIGQGVENTAGGHELTKSICYSLDFQKESKSGRMAIIGASIFSGLAWEVKLRGKITDGFSFLQAVSEYRTASKAKVDKAIASAPTVANESAPKKKTSKKKSAKKKAAKKAVVKANPVVVDVPSIAVEPTPVVDTPEVAPEQDAN